MTKKKELQNVPASIRSKFDITLTQLRFQQLADEASKIVYNEDNVELIQNFIKKVKNVIKAVSEVHKEGKREVLEVGRQWDSAKNFYTEELNEIISIPQRKIEKIALEINERQRKEEAERVRVLSIQKGIQDNLIMFANGIAACDTYDQLLDIERKINLEKTREHKYQEFTSEAVLKFDTLNNSIKDQKLKIRELEKIKAEKEKAEKTGDYDSFVKAEEKMIATENLIQDNKVLVQEKVLEMEPDIIVPEIISPTVKARRTTWKFELVDEKEAMKKAPELLEVSLNQNKAKEVLNTLKDSGVLNDKKEYVLNGVRYYEHQTF